MSAITAVGRLSKIKKIREIPWDEDLVHKPGVYLLRETRDGHVRYIGRSDEDIRSALLYDESIPTKRFPLYAHRHTEDALQAFEAQCQYYHQYRQSLDNTAHPISPKGTNLKCPIHSCDL